MPSKKKKFNARFPPVKLFSIFSMLFKAIAYFNVLLLFLKARIKKIMQTDEDVGKVAAAVPVIICILSQLFRSEFIGTKVWLVGTKAYVQILKCEVRKWGIQEWVAKNTDPTFSFDDPYKIMCCRLSLFLSVSEENELKIN